MNDDKFMKAYRDFCNTAAGVLAGYVEDKTLQHSIGEVVLSGARLPDVQNLVSVYYTIQYNSELVKILSSNNALAVKVANNMTLRGYRIEADTSSVDDTTSSDYSTYGEVIDSDTAEKLSSLGTNYSMVKWDHEFYVEGSDHTLVASTATTPDGIVVAITNLGSKSVSFTGSAHIKGDTNSLSDSIALLEPCLAVGGTTINYTECDSANITSITLEDCSITDAYLTAADWSVNATITTDGTSSSDYGDNVSINYSYESSTGCSYTSLKVLLLNNAGEVLGYGIGFVNDVSAGENITGTMYAITAPHSLDSLADMAMFSCPTLE